MPITDSNILKKLYNAFDPTPLHPDVPEEWALYIDLQAVRGDSNILRDIGQHIEWSDKPTCQLYAGHRGAGKSTELLRLKQHLKRQDYCVVYFAADEGDIDPEDAGYADILLACTRQLIKGLNATSPAPLGTWLQKCWSALKDFSQTEIDIEVAGQAEIELAFTKLTATLRGSPSARKQIRDRVDPHTVDLLDALNEFISEASHSGIKAQQLVLIVDNLDRIVPIYDVKKEKTNHEEIFIDRVEQLTALNCHVVYTVPISLVYSEQGTLLKDRYENMGRLPMITVAERGSRAPFEVGLQAFLTLLETRMQQAAGCGIKTVFGDEAVVRELCLLSGGHLRDLMKLLQGTLRHLPQFQDAEKAAARAVIREREAYADAIDEEDWARLAAVYRSQQILNEQDYRQLLFNRSVLEYQSASLDESQNAKWHDVHPLIVAIEQFKQAKEKLEKENKST